MPTSTVPWSSGIGHVCFIDKPWACTLNAVDWLREGFSAGKLDYLGIQFGWFYESHHALADCEACLALLAQMLPQSGRRVMSVVREAALLDDYLIRAIHTPTLIFATNSSSGGYRWRPADLPDGKVWWTITTEPEDEIAWLHAEIYGCEAEIPVRKISALSRFSERMWQIN